MLEYVPGSAWCVATDAAVFVFESTLEPSSLARLWQQLHDVREPEALLVAARTVGEPLACVLWSSDGTRVGTRGGVPAVQGERLPDHFGPLLAWQRVGEGAVEIGRVGDLERVALPGGAGVLQVAAVRVLDARVALGGAGVSSVVSSFGESQPAAQRVPLVEESVSQARPEPEAAAQLPDAGSDSGQEAPAPSPQSETDAEALCPDVTVEGYVEERAAQPDVQGDEGLLADVQHDDRARGNDAPVAAESGARLIDSVPGYIRPAAATSAASAAAAVQPPKQQPSADASRVGEQSAAVLGDHDGETISAARAQELRGRAEAAADAHSAAPATGPLVLSAVCPAGHTNQPTAAHCLVCGAEIAAGSLGQRPRPEFAVAVFPNGDRVPFGRGIVVGRRPRSARADGARPPRLVAVASPNEDISRSHLELRAEEWNLVAVDLDSTNGTVLSRPGVAPQRLRPQSPTIIVPGDTLDLGDGVTVRIEHA